MATFTTQSFQQYDFDGTTFTPTPGGFHVDGTNTISEIAPNDDGSITPGETLDSIVYGGLDGSPDYTFVGTYTDADGDIFYMFQDNIGDYYLEAFETVAEVQGDSTPSFPASINTSTDPNWDDTSATMICFAADTRIATETGETLVADLKIGDLVRTAAGGVTPVRWVGRQTIVTRFAGERAALVRIRAGALGQGLPHADLTVTADHGMVIDDLVINASALVNGSSIDWVPDLPERFTVYHVETAEHDAILANGAAAETFIDYRGRQAFDNYVEYTALYGHDRSITEMPLPRISTPRLLPTALRAQLGLAQEQLTA